MSLRTVETADLIAELTRRVGPAAYRSHRAPLDFLSQLIGIEQKDADPVFNNQKE